MSKKFTKEDAIAQKKRTFKKLTALLEGYINKPLPQSEKEIDYTKKAVLIGKWIEQYANYISFEEKFKPTKIINYKRGDIVFANFGFNVGSEFGGNHYAVVLDKNSHHNASNITVIPLSSVKEEKSVHERDVYLGNELYEKLQLKLKTKVLSLQERHLENRLMLDLIKDQLRSPQSADSNTAEIMKLEDELTKRQRELDKDIIDTDRIKNELFCLKTGSIAKVEQIRTISKLRIYNPKTSTDPLYGIHFSEPTMVKINSKIKELFIFDE